MGWTLGDDELLAGVELDVDTALVVLVGAGVDVVAAGVDDEVGALP